MPLNTLFAARVRPSTNATFAICKWSVYDAAMNALESAIKEAGSAAELARRLGVVPMTVSQWKKRGQVPAERCLDVEAATGVSRHDLRPDVFGPAPEAEAVNRAA